MSYAHVIRHVQSHINQYLSVLDRASLATSAKALKWHGVVPVAQIDEYINVATSIFRTLQRNKKFHTTFCDEHSAVVINVTKGLCTIRTSKKMPEKSSKQTTIEVITLQTHSFEDIHSMLRKHNTIPMPRYIACGKI